MLVITTHYQRLLNHIVADVVHVFSDEQGGGERAEGAGGSNSSPKGYAGFDEAAQRDHACSCADRPGRADG